MPAARQAVAARAYSLQRWRDPSRPTKRWQKTRTGAGYRTFRDGAAARYCAQALALAGDALDDIGKSADRVRGCANPDRDRPHSLAGIARRLAAWGSGDIGPSDWEGPDRRAWRRGSDRRNMAGGERAVQRETLKAFGLSHGRFAPPGYRSVTDEMPAVQKPVRTVRTTHEPHHT